MTETGRQNGAALDEQAKAVEAGLAMHLRVKAELDDAQKENAELRDHLARTAVEIEALRSFSNLLESRIEGCVAERDLAVKERAQLEALFSMVFAAMREFKIPEIKLNEAAHAHRTNPA